MVYRPKEPVILGHLSPIHIVEGFFLVILLSGQLGFGLGSLQRQHIQERQQQLRVRINVSSLICFGNLLASDHLDFLWIFNVTLEATFIDQCFFLLVKLHHFGFIRQ